MCSVYEHTPLLGWHASEMHPARIGFSLWANLGAISKDDMARRSHFYTTDEQYTDKIASHSATVLRLRLPKEPLPKAELKKLELYLYCQSMGVFFDGLVPANGPLLRYDGECIVLGVAISDKLPIIHPDYAWDGSAFIDTAEVRHRKEKLGCNWWSPNGLGVWGTCPGEGWNGVCGATGATSVNGSDRVGGARFNENILKMQDFVALKNEGGVIKGDFRYIGWKKIDLTPLLKPEEDYWDKEIAIIFFFHFAYSSAANSTVDIGVAWTFDNRNATPKDPPPDTYTEKIAGPFIGIVWEKVPEVQKFEEPKVKELIENIDKLEEIDGLGFIDLEWEESKDESFTAYGLFRDTTSPVRIDAAHNFAIIKERGTTRFRDYDSKQFIENGELWYYTLVHYNESYNYPVPPDTNYARGMKGTEIKIRRPLVDYINPDSPFMHITPSIKRVSDNIVPNGTFDDPRHWIWKTNWVHNPTTKEADHKVGATDSLEHETVFGVAGQVLQVVYTVRNRTTGSIKFRIGGVDGTSWDYNDTFYEEVIAMGTGKLEFIPTSDFNGSIDNVSVRLASYSIKTFERVYLGFPYSWSMGENVEPAFQHPIIFQIDWGDGIVEAYRFKPKRVHDYDLSCQILYLENTEDLVVGDYVIINVSPIYPVAYLRKIIRKTMDIIELDIPIDPGITFHGGVYVQKAPYHIYTAHGEALISVKVYGPNGFANKVSILEGQCQLYILQNKPQCRLVAIPPTVRENNNIVLDLGDSDTMTERLLITDKDWYLGEVCNYYHGLETPYITDVKKTALTGFPYIPAGTYRYRLVSVEDVPNGRFSLISKQWSIEVGTNEATRITIDFKVPFNPNGLRIDIYKYKDDNYKNIGYIDSVTLGSGVFLGTYHDDDKVPGPLLRENGVTRIIRDARYSFKPFQIIPKHWYYPGSPEVSIPAGQHEAIAIIRNKIGLSALEESPYFSEPVSILYNVKSDILLYLNDPDNISKSLRDGYQAIDLPRGREVATDIYFGDIPVVVSNVRVMRKITISGKAFSMSKLNHPILEVNADSECHAMVGTVPDDVITWRYVEKTGCVVVLKIDNRTDLTYVLSTYSEREMAENLYMIEWRAELIEVE